MLKLILFFGIISMMVFLLPNVFALSCIEGYMPDPNAPLTSCISDPNYIGVNPFHQNTQLILGVGVFIGIIAIIIVIKKRNK